MKSSIILLALAASSVCFAQVEKEVDSFGGNQALYEKAKALNPEVENEVIQDRFSNRSIRFELAPEMATVFGGDSYNKTNNAGINAHFHITPKWSIGVKYAKSSNTLTPEGQAMVSRAEDAARVNPQNPDYLFPEVVYPKSQTLGMINWYPLVGKLSFGKFGVAHFDPYLTVGYGTMELSNGDSPTKSFGTGLGFWWSSHFTTRLEYRFEQYQAEYYQKTVDMNTSIASLQVGWML